jgi:hypothetical protein
MIKELILYKYKLIQTQKVFIVDHTTVFRLVKTK